MAGNKGKQDTCPKAEAHAMGHILEKASNSLKVDFSKLHWNILKTLENNLSPWWFF